jgi:hypothetical protein
LVAVAEKDAEEVVVSQLQKKAEGLIEAVS